MLRVSWTFSRFDCEANAIVLTEIFMISPQTSQSCSHCWMIPFSFEVYDRIKFYFVSSFSSVWNKCRLWNFIIQKRSQQVCAIWRACLISDRDSGGRWKEAKEKFLENVDFSVNHPQFKAHLYKASPRKALSSVANILASPTKFGEVKRSQDEMPPPVVISPSKIRHKLFAEVSLETL